MKDVCDGRICMAHSYHFPNLFENCPFVLRASSNAQQTVASVNVKLKEIEALPDRKHKPRWFPLYGAPVTVPSVTELAEIALRITARNVGLLSLYR